MLDAEAKKMAEILLAALRAELEGRHFFLMAAHSSKDPKGKKVFEVLAQEEADHHDYLEKQYKAVLETGKPDPSLSLSEKNDLSGSSPIFSDAIRSRLGEAHFEMTALAIGIQLEMSAMAFYKKAAEEAVDPTLKKLFQELSDWESGHYHGLLAQQENLKEDYWSSAGFTPF